MPVQPDAEIMQGNPGRQPGLKALQFMRALPVQPEGMMELAENRLHHLAYPGQPPAQSLGPAGPAVALGRTDYPGAIAVPPPLAQLPARKALVGQVPAPGRLSQSGQPGMGSMPEGEEVPGQSRVIGAGWGKAEAGDDPMGIDGEQQVEALIPAQTVAPANVSLSGEPAGPPALGVSGGDAGTVQGFLSRAS